MADEKLTLKVEGQFILAGPDMSGLCPICNGLYKANDWVFVGSDIPDEWPGGRVTLLDLHLRCFSTWIESHVSKGNSVILGFNGERICELSQPPFRIGIEDYRV